MPKPCLGRVDLENYRAGRGWSCESLFAVFFLYCKRVDPEWSLQDTCDWIFGVVIATTRVNLFKGSLYNFATQGFSGNTCFKHSSRILFEELSCTKPSILRAPKC